MFLFRPVGQKELDLIESLGWRAFPPRLDGQPIFYPVHNRAYAEQIARDGNTHDSGSDYVGYVLRFEVDDDFVSRYPVHVAGGREHRELWVPAEELDVFNTKISAYIEVLAEYRGPQGGHCHAPIKEAHLGDVRAWDWLAFVEHNLSGPDGAWHALSQAPDVILPLLMNAYAGAADQRAFLVEVVWQHRNPHTLPFLATAVKDSSAPVWKVALDGLVAMKAVVALSRLREHSLQTGLEDKVAWLDEAIEQAGESEAELP